MKETRQIYYNETGEQLLIEMPISDYQKLAEQAGRPEDLATLQSKLENLQDFLAKNAASFEPTSTSRLLPIYPGVRAKRIPLLSTDLTVSDIPAVNIPLPTEEEISNAPPTESAEVPVTAEEEDRPDNSRNFWNFWKNDAAESSPAEKTTQDPSPASVETNATPPETKPAAKPVPSPRQPEPSQQPPAKEGEQKRYPISIASKILRFLEERDSSGSASRILQTYCQELSNVCNGRISTSLQQNVVCLWNYDEWSTFAYFHFSENQFYLSVKQRLVPDKDPRDVWSPPKGLCDEPLARFRLDNYDEKIIPLLLEGFKNA